MVSIGEYFREGSRLVIQRPDETVSIADLACHIEFDPRDVYRYQTTPEIAALWALEEEYEKYGEVTEKFQDYYDGVWMEFKDGSVLRIRSL